jgi:hypothetical protein
MSYLSEHISLLQKFLHFGDEAVIHIILIYAGVFF